MSDWAGFWIGLALFLSVITAGDVVDKNAARIWPDRPAATVDYTRCPYAAGC